MHISYLLDSDSFAWWWPQAAAGTVAAAAITAILVVPATGADEPVEPARPDPRFTTMDPEMDRPCFLTRAQWNVALDQRQPRCGDIPSADQEQQWGTGTPRPGLNFLP